jgi:hypothetical protein
MNVHAHETEPQAPRSGDCGCGGKCGCETRCCDLECLVRPNFFCGQLLTDADLDAAVDWARTRFSLARYRHGWGVVCGLDVTCSHPHGRHDCCPDPRTGPTIYVHPGYAIDCCGNDLVVCEPLCVDLSEICRPLDDPCRPSKNGKKNGTQQPPPNQDRYPDCWELLGRDLIAVDLKLRYHEDAAQGQRAMFRSGCSDQGPCEYSRVHENPCVHAEIGELECDDDADYRTWLAEFEERRARVQREIQATIRLGPEGILKYLRRHPPYKFCFLEELVCCLLDEADRDNQSQSGRPDWRAIADRVAYFLYLDWILHEIECPCWVCRPDHGVPLGRVLLKRVRVQGEEACRVRLIDVSAPHRRPLRKDSCRPVPRGAIDLFPYLWQSDRYAREQLGALGVTVNEEPAPSDVDLFARLNPTSLTLDSATRRVNAWIVTDPFNCKRVVGFGGANNP